MSKIYLGSKSERNAHSVFLKKLSVDEKFDDLPAILRGRKEQLQNFKQEKTLITYLWKGPFEANNLITVVLACDDY